MCAYTLGDVFLSSRSTGYRAVRVFWRSARVVMSGVFNPFGVSAYATKKRHAKSGRTLIVFTLFVNNTLAAQTSGVFEVVIYRMHSDVTLSPVCGSCTRR